MPSIKDDNTVNLLAQEYCSNGRMQEKAMLAVGYSKAYAKSYCGKLWANPKIKAAIERFQAKTAAKAERTVQSLDAMYQEAYDLAKHCHNPNTASMNGSITGIARLYGMDKDAGTATDKALTLTEAELARAQLITKNLLKQA